MLKYNSREYNLTLQMKKLSPYSAFNNESYLVKVV